MPESPAAELSDQPTRQGAREEQRAPGEGAGAGAREELARTETADPVPPAAAPYAGFANRTTWQSGSGPIALGTPRPEGDHPHGEGRYVVHREIGRGGMGRVVAATDLVLGRTVAVKEALTTDPDAVRRFARETEITARLEHPAIVPVYDAGFDADGLPYYVMRKVSGQPLERLVESTRSLSKRLTLLPHVLSAAQAIAHAHRRSVLHRDLKPSNILVGEFGETIVIDWGLAKVTDEVDDPQVDPLPSSGGHVLTQAGAVFGTPGFMSPEQIAGKSADARTDVYALGATLYFLLAQRAPHHAPSAKEIMALAGAGPPAPIAKIVPGVPRDLAWIVDTALAFDPEKRYPNAGALAAELENFLSGQLVASRHYTRRERLVRFVRRNRIAVIAVVAAAIGLGIAVSRVLAARASAQAAYADAVVKQRQTQQAHDEMTLNHARSLLATNPTASIVVARRLARSHWRQVRAIAAAARYAGACVGLPGPVNPSSVTIAPGGRMATINDRDGAVWLTDLDRRTSRPLVHFQAPGVRAVWAGDERLVVYGRKRLAVVDLASGAVRDLAVEPEVLSAAATRTAVFVVSKSGKLNRLELDGPGRAQLDVADTLAVQVSPDGRKLAVETRTGLVLIDLAGGAAPVRVIDRPVIDVRWEASSLALSVHLHDDREIVLLALEPEPSIVARRPTGLAGTHLPWRGRLVTVDLDGIKGAVIGQLTRTAGATDFPLALARGDTVVVGRRSGTITLLHERVGVELRAPSDDLMRLTASPGSPYLVAAAPGRLFLWNLDHILPDMKRISQVQQFAAIGPQRLLIGSVLGDWAWYDLATGTETPFKVPFGPYHVLQDGRGDLAALVYDARSNQRGFVIAQYGRPPTFVSTEVSAITVSGGMIIAGTPGGEVYDVEPVTRSATVVAARTGHAVRSLGMGEHWRSVRWADGVVWRRGPGGREEWGTLAVGSSSLPVLLQQRDGRVCAATRTAIECWSGDGSTQPIAKMPMEIMWAELVTDGMALVTLADRGLYQVDMTTGNITGIGATGGIVPTFALPAGLAVADRPDHSVSVIDLVANTSWPMTSAFFGGNQGARITTDGSLVAVLAADQDLLVWRLDLPRTPEETEAWLDEITNATAEHGTKRVDWAPADQFRRPSGDQDRAR